ncbi:MAG: DUF3108 domain-containing protein [Candidatus Omnitrophota bacterium]
MTRPVKSLIIILLVFFISGCMLPTRYRILRSPEKPIVIKEPRLDFKIGERFTYKAEWLGMDVAVAILTVEGVEELKGRKVYRIVATANTTSILAKLYKVEDRITTYIDVEELHPLRYEKKQREGRYRADEYFEFDQENGKVFYFSNLNNSKKEIDTPPHVQDPLSALYYFRLQNAKVGESMFANLNADEKNYLLDAKVHKKGLVRIKGVGEWEAFMVEPLPWFGGKVERKAKAIMWFSADERRIPLIMSIKSIPLVGTVTITLQKIEYLDT